MKKTLAMMCAATMFAAMTACNEGDNTETRRTGDLGELLTDGGETYEVGFPTFALPYEFDTIDVYNNEVSNADFTDKKAYFIYNWATWCGPCVESMPTIAELAEKYGDDVGFIGLLGDFGTNHGDARNILKSVDMPENFRVIDQNASSAIELYDAVRTGAYPSALIITTGGEYSESIVGKVGDRHIELLEAVANG
ncbi:MAG: TlpA family protein disulfide reductase [Oscillospiraceae bacterium]|nr:TlpA family protein disulfide reductase [Oscillospiraceae bacterium]